VIQKSPMICFNTLFGAIQLTSPYLWKPGEGSTPLLESLSLRHCGRSEAVNRALGDFGSEESFGQAAKRFQEHYKYDLHASTVSRVTKQIADEALDYLEDTLSHAEEKAESGPSSAVPVDEMLVELDGCEVRTAVLVPVEASREPSPASPSPKKRKEIAWRDVRIGIVRPLEAESKLYVGKKAGYPVVVNDLVQTAVLQGFSSTTTVIGVADGGIGLKEELERQFPGMQFILDKPHLTSHLYETADGMGLEAAERTAWVTSRLDAISDGRVEQVKQQLDEEYAAQPNDRLRRLIGYLERFSDAVDYNAFQAQGYPIGSGEVESAHRAIPQKRLKLPGACWHPDSINPMLALRVLRANGWWEDFWDDRVEKLLAA
jgi:hypothetical protein